MIEVKVEKLSDRYMSVQDIYPGDVFFQKRFPGEALLMTSSKKENEKIAVVLETGESLFLPLKTKVSRLANEARLYIKH